MYSSLVQVAIFCQNIVPSATIHSVENMKHTFLMNVKRPHLFEKRINVITSSQVPLLELYITVALQVNTHRSCDVRMDWFGNGIVKFLIG